MGAVCGRGIEEGAGVARRVQRDTDSREAASAGTGNAMSALLMYSALTAASLRLRLRDREDLDVGGLDRRSSILSPVVP